MKAYHEEGFPVTIVRPSLTYGETQSTLAINIWTKSYTAVARMRRGKKLIVPGDGSSLWVISLPCGISKPCETAKLLRSTPLSAESLGNPRSCLFSTVAYLPSHSVRSAQDSSVEPS